MAFFGLTALGPQNSFSTSSTYFRNLQVFDEKDFEAAWNTVTNGNDYCHKSDLQPIFRALFHGPIPQNDRAPIENAFFSVKDDIVTYSTFIKIMDKLRADAEDEMNNLEGKSKPTCEFISSSEFKESLKRNAAIKREVQTKQTAPLTAAQEVRQNFLAMVVK